MRQSLSKLAFAFILSGCAVNQKTVNGPLYQYRADMRLSVGLSEFEGMGVTKLNGPVHITLNSPVALDRLQITSCARQDVIQNAAVPYIYMYTPVQSELEGLCPLYIEAYSKENLTSWGFVGFRADEKLPAHIDCNGEGITYAGLTVCQTKNGLEQKMTFKKPVRFSAETACHLATTDNQNFTATPDKGICRATFTDGVDWHRLILFGYDQVLVRVK